MFSNFRRFQMTTKNFQTLHVWDTTHSADSVEWCPISPFKNSFALGTYQLIEKIKEDSYERIGDITIFTVLKDKLEVEDRINSPAVTDMKWCSKKLSGEIALAVANAEAEVSLFYFIDKKLHFVSKCVLKKTDEHFLTLSLDWVKEDVPDAICASDSKGNITFITVNNGLLSVLKEWNAHVLEAWIVCFDSFNRNIMYSGGDDVQLKVWDCRCEEPQKVISSAKHTAGVTALNSSLHKEHNLLSGSFDETILFWDTRNMKKSLEEIKAKGGVWRLKWEPKPRSKYILSACVFGGFQIYNANIFSSVDEYKEHESLAYGADWCFLDSDESDGLLKSDEYLIATCSFYDHKLCVSLWKENFEEIT